MDEDGRRRSSRIKKLDKEIRYDDRGGDIEDEEPVVKKKRNSKSNKDVNVTKKIVEEKQSIDESNDLGEVITAAVEHEGKIGGENGVESVEKGRKSVGKGRKSVQMSMKSAEMGLESGEKSAESAEKSDYAKVRATIRAFNSHYLHFVQEEELRVKNLEIELKNKKDDGTAAKRPSKRPDLKAISQMMENNTILYPDKRPGHLPGVDVGHQFYSRAEMCVVGLHNHWLNGIDFMGDKFKKVAEFKNYTFPVAISIVLSGQYEDDLDNCEDVIYTGQGGNDLLGNKSQIADQVMKRGNLALKNNIGQNVPVRVIRGLKCASSYCGKVYTYDGLYNVVNYWAEKGVSGYTIFKYRLKRLEGQPVLTTNQVQFTRAQAPKCADDIRGLVCKDISGGQENIPIPATNLVDDPAGPPTGLTYITTAQVSASVRMPKNTFGCKCKGACIDPSICACAKLNGSEFPYVSKDGGRLIEAKDVVYECGPHCGCGPACVNKTSQRGLKYRLEVYRTPKKGWGVRSWDFIPSGAFVCEYIGVIKRTDEVHDPENFFIFDIDCLQTMKGLDGRERRKGDVSISPGALSDKAADDEVDYCIDAGVTGNVTRYINHSCAPNLFVQCVLSDHHDIKLARIVLFAADNIPPLQELSYDYGYAVDSVVDKEGNIKHMDCYCGAPDCKKRMF